jgi:hypothetical protein
MIWDYVKALWAEWNTRLMGLLAAPLAIGAAFISDEKWKTTSWIVAAVMFVIASFLVWRREFKERVALQQKEEGLPNIILVPRGFYVEDRLLLMSDTIGPQGQAINVRQKTMNSLLARLMNDPIRSTAEAIAKDVTARITFYNSQNRELFFMDARWGDANRPKPGQSNIELLSADFSIGQTRELDIAFKLPEDENCWG